MTDQFDYPLAKGIYLEENDATTIDNEASQNEETDTNVYVTTDGKLRSKRPAENEVTYAPQTTKGDIAVHDGATNQRLPVGLDGQVLIADSTTSLGVRYATFQGNSGGGGGTTSLGNLFCQVIDLSGGQSITNTFAKVPFNTNTRMDPAFERTGSTVTFKQAGTFLVQQAIHCTMSSGTHRFRTQITLNDVTIPKSTSYTHVPIMNTTVINIQREINTVSMTLYVKVEADDELAVEVKEDSFVGNGFLGAGSTLDIYQLDCEERYQFGMNALATNTSEQVIPFTTIDTDITVGTPFTTSGGTLTCQVSGTYVFITNLHAAYSGDNNEDTFVRIRPRINGSTQSRVVYHDCAGKSNALESITYHHIFNLSANNTIDWLVNRAEQNSYNSSDVMTLINQGTLLITQFPSTVTIESRNSNATTVFDETPWLNITTPVQDFNSTGINYANNKFQFTRPGTYVVFGNNSTEMTINTNHLSWQTRGLLNNSLLPGSDRYRTTSLFRNNNVGRRSIQYNTCFSVNTNDIYNWEVRSTNYNNHVLQDTQIITLIELDMSTSGTITDPGNPPVPTPLGYGDVYYHHEVDTLISTNTLITALEWTSPSVPAGAYRLYYSINVDGRLRVRYFLDNAEIFTTNSNQNFIPYTPVTMNFHQTLTEGAHVFKIDVLPRNTDTTVRFRYAHVYLCLLEPS